MDLLDPLPALSLVCQRPAVQHRTERHPVWKALLGGEGDHSYGALLDSLPLATKLIEHGGSAQDKTEAKGRYNLLRQEDHLLTLCQSLVRIAQTPQCPGAHAA